jgi:chromosome segregation ATPase
MTGLDCLREEMEKRGLNKSQIESKVAAVVLDIVANAGNKYTEMQEQEQKATKRLKEIETQLENTKMYIEHYKRLLSKWDSEIENAREHRKHCEYYIDEFNKSISECETPEGRDAMRIAQMFVNSVNVDTKYDNTAYIIGLASILSKGNINAIGELQKINKKLPKI